MTLAMTMMMMMLGIMMVMMMMMLGIMMVLMIMMVMVMMMLMMMMIRLITLKLIRFRCMQGPMKKHFVYFALDQVSGFS